MQTLILGLDAFDATRFEQLSEQGKLPNLTKYVEARGYARFEVANPPQSEVSWTSIATGLNPGGHGLFDFVYRDPATYNIGVSLLPTKRGFIGSTFARPFSARTVFDQAVHQGFPATVLWWPATFPAQPQSPVHTLPGLGTPDIHGRLGVGTLFVADGDLAQSLGKTPVATFRQSAKGRLSGLLPGPVRKTRRGARESAVELHLEMTDDGPARLSVGGQTLELVEGRWSRILDLAFRVGRGLSIHALTRVILSRVQPNVKLYFLPLQLHPMHSLWPYATPRSFVKKVWKSSGPFLTLGWPQDTTGLEDDCITDRQFLDLCSSVLSTRERILMHQLGRFREGILATVFDSLDRVQHMFRRDRPDIVEEWYVRLDDLVGRVGERLSALGNHRCRVIIVSDHGFSGFDYKVHLNRWLVDNGYLATREAGDSGSLREVDWSRSRSYAIGLNSLYLNLVGREGEGCVQEEDREALTRKLKDQLLSWRGPDGRPVVQRLWDQCEAFEGPLAEYGPDVVVGYSPGFRASAQTGLGKWEQAAIEPNRDHWGAGHCIDPEAVPGVLFSSQGLSHLSQPSYRDIPPLTTGTAIDRGDSALSPPSYNDEDENTVEERLRGLGYL